MTHPISRRHWLKTATLSLAAPAGLLHAQSAPVSRTFAPQPGPWRQFEVTTAVQVPTVKGNTRLWLPLPDVESDYQRGASHQWSGNASQAKLVSDPARGVRMLYAEFDARVGPPSLQLTSTVQTRNRAVDWQAAPTGQSDSADALRQALAPTELLPLDGIVRSTARAATQGARTDVEKVKAVYQWVLANAHREPKTRGCGPGDIRAMLETGNLGGKCADLNALFVGLCRAVGVPARDVYGLRLAPSSFGYRELGGNPANLKGAQHCRAEVHLQHRGWVAMDPADALKVMRQETPEWIKDTAHPLVAPVVKGLFGGWEGNWVAWNTTHDVVLPGSRHKASLPFFMYPQGENDGGRFDDLAPDSFRYTISAKEIV